MRTTMKNAVKRVSAICLACLLMLSGVLTTAVQAEAIWVEKAIWPFHGNVRVSQLASGYYPTNWYSHNLSDMYAMDVYPEDGKAYAPFSCRVVDILLPPTYTGNIVVIESLGLVRFADGTRNYAHAIFIHDSVINDNVWNSYNTGEPIYQGDYFYDVGTAGGVDAHIHIEARKGQYEGWRWYPGTSPYWDDEQGKMVYTPVYYYRGEANTNNNPDPNADPKRIFFINIPTYNTYFTCSDSRNAEILDNYFYTPGDPWNDNNGNTGGEEEEGVDPITPTVDPFWTESWQGEGSLTETDVKIGDEFHYPTETDLNRVGCFMGTDANAVAKATPDDYSGAWMVSEAVTWSPGFKDGHKYSYVEYTATGDPASALGFGQVLSPGTTYYYKFFATLQGNSQVYMGSVDHFTTAGGTVTPPSPPPVTPPTTTVTTTVQKAIWPLIGEMRVNQLSSGIIPAGRWESHRIADMFAIDANAAGAFAYAPFDCRVVDILPNWGNIAVIESVNPVYLADGSIDYVHVAFVHDDDISNLIIAYNTGEIIPQWTPIYDEGTTAGNGWTVGKHIHIEARRGRYENYKGASGTITYSGRPTGFSIGNSGSYSNVVYLAGNTSISDPKNIFFGAAGYGTYFNCSPVNDWEGEVETEYFQYWKYTDSFTQEITTTVANPYWHDGSWVNDGTLTDNDVQVEHWFYYPENTSLGIVGCFMGTDESAVANATAGSHDGAWMVSEDASGWGHAAADNGMWRSKIYYSAQGDLASASGFGQVLSPGTTYYYKFFITWQGNGQVYTSEVNHFTTTGTAATKPTVLTYSTLMYNEKDDALYLLYPAKTSDDEIKKELSAGNLSAVYIATKSAAVLYSDGKRYQQIFTFADVTAGQYKLVTYKPGYCIGIQEIHTDMVETDAIEMALWGDVTGEGKVNAGDLQKLFQHVNKKITLEQAYILSADVTKDGKVNAGDLQKLFQFVNKRITTLD